jgi:hypothetical protein
MPIKYLYFDLCQSGTSPQPVVAGLFVYLKKRRLIWGFKIGLRILF